MDEGALEAYRLRVDVTREQLDWLAAGGWDIAGRDLTAGWVEVITDRDGLARLSGLGYDVEIIETHSRPAVLRPAITDPPTSGRPQENPLTDTLYTDPAELDAFLQQTALDHPSLVRLESIGTSTEGRDIWAVMISDNAAVDEDELSVLINGAHHAREVMTPEAVMDVIDHLTDNYGVDPAITAHVDAYQIWTVPMVNPDGVELVHTIDYLWRKNARDNDTNGRITWKDGVDNNRNYPWGWGGQCQGSSDGETQATYRGPYEASEPENQAMIDLGRRIQPVFYVEYHSYGEDVFYAMGCDPARFSPKLSTIQGGPDQSINRVIAEQYAALLMAADGAVGFLPSPFGSRVDGIGRDHQAHQTGAISFVTELNSLDEGGFSPDFATYRQLTVEGQRAGWLWLLDRIAGPAVGGHVFDSITGLPVVADITLDEMTLPDGRRETTRVDSGRFHVIVVPGSYTLRVSAPGYVDSTVPVTVGADWGPLVVQLVPTGSMLLAEEQFEEATAAAAWTLDPTDSAISGIWGWGDPLSTHAGTVQSADLELAGTGYDRTPGAGGYAFATGNAPAALLSDDDVDGGATTLLSPSFDLLGFYGVQLNLQHWFTQDPDDPLDCLDVDVSVDGGGVWHNLESVCASTSTPDAPDAWVPLSLRVDDTVQPGADTRFRFRVTDDGDDHIVEASIDEFGLRGFAMATQGKVDDLRLLDASTGSVSWSPVVGPGDIVYDLVRGELSALSTDGSSVDLGPLTCLVADLASPSTVVVDGLPPVGAGWFYQVRFRLGQTIGDWGVASQGVERQASAPVCP